MYLPINLILCCSSKMAKISLSSKMPSISVSSKSSTTTLIPINTVRFPWTLIFLTLLRNSPSVAKKSLSMSELTATCLRTKINHMIRRSERLKNKLLMMRVKAFKKTSRNYHCRSTSTSKKKSCYQTTILGFWLICEKSKHMITVKCRMCILKSCRSATFLRRKGR
jgi:hypothetical protein